LTIPTLIFIAQFFIACSGDIFSKNELLILDYQNNRQIRQLLAVNKPFDNSKDRFRLCLAIGNNQDASLVVAVEPFLTDPSPLVRSGAAFALGLLPCRESSRLLTTRLQTETDNGVVRQIAISLGRTGAIEQLQLLQDHTNNNLSKTTLYKTAVHFFSRGIMPRSMVSECCRALMSGNRSERQTAAVALLRIRQPEIFLPHVTILLSASDSPDPSIRSAVARLLRELSFLHKNDLYLRFISDPDWRVRYEAAMAVPFLTIADSFWVSLLNDQKPYVVAAALQNPPANITWNNEILDIVGDLFSSKSRSVAGAATRIVYAHTDSIFQKIQRRPLSNENLLTEKVAGIGGRLPSREALDLILPHINHRKKSVSTAAYSGILNHLDSLVYYNMISGDEQCGFIISGLNSGDPVNMFLAANYIYSSQNKIPDIEHQLYRCLEKYRSFQYLESQLMIIRAIEKIHPADAPAHLFPLLNSQYHQIQDESYRILVNSYAENIAEPLPAADPCLYRSLSKMTKYGLNPVVKLETNRGTILIQCNAFYAPYTVDAFLGRVDDGYYNGLSFHRVVPNFVIQAGDPRGDGWGGPNYHLQTERSPLSYETGSVGMASAGPDTEGSQFFITTSPQYHLDYNYTLFGQVTGGINVVETIEIGDKIISARVMKPSQ